MKYKLQSQPWYPYTDWLLRLLQAGCVIERVVPFLDVLLGPTVDQLRTQLWIRLRDQLYVQFGARPENRPEVRS